MIEFEPQTHTYQIDGRTVPSVTQVLEQIQTLEHIPPATLERARIRGQHVHEAMALLVRNDLDWDSLDEELVPYVEAGQRFLNESGIVVLGSELRVGCPVARCAGTIDLYGVLRKDEVIVDFKAAADVPEPVGPQTAGYDYLYEKSYGGGKRTRKRKRLCVRLRPDGKYKVDRLGDSDDYNVFFSCLNLWHWRNKHWR